MLRAAAYEGDLTTLAAALGLGVWVDAISESNVSALHLAAQQGQARKEIRSKNKYIRNKKYEIRNTKYEIINIIGEVPIRLKRMRRCGFLTKPEGEAESQRRLCQSFGRVDRDGLSLGCGH